MIPVQSAVDTILSKISGLGAESVDLSAAVGRVLAEDVIADTDLPPFDRSQMDGFALVAADTSSVPVKLRLIGESAAGHGWHAPIHSGEAVRIMTGAPVPPGSDAVQKVELTSEAADHGEKAWGTSDISEGPETVEIRGTVKPERNIVRRGSEIKSGDKVFSRGDRVTMQMISVLAAFGYAKVAVSKAPQLGILATGSEIVPVDQKPGPDHIRNSNAPMLAALAAAFGAIAHAYPLADDDVESLKASISTAAAESDLLVITGGVSVGKYDLTKAALLDLGASIFFDKVSLKPGKPTVFTAIDGNPVFGLPGNPVSAAVTFHLFVRPALMKMQNASDLQMRTGHAVMAADVKAAKERDTYLPTSLETDVDGRLIATPLKYQGSSDFVGFAMAEGLIFIPAGHRFDRGDVSRIFFL